MRIKFRKCWKIGRLKVYHLFYLKRKKIATTSNKETGFKYVEIMKRLSTIYYDNTYRNDQRKIIVNGERYYMYRTIDLCAGIGGIRCGFERTGHFKNVLSAEIDEYAARTYEHIFNENPRNDLTSKEFKDKVAGCNYDVLLAGFPCQPFSSQGNLDGFSDPTKGTIFFHLKQIIKRTRPKVIFLENVQNIVSHDKKKTIKIIIDSLEKKLNYKVVGVTYAEDGGVIYNKDSFVRNTKDFGLPQNRPRAYFIAFDREVYGTLLDKKDFKNELPRKLNERLSNNPYLNHNLQDILEDKVDLHYYMSASYLETLEKHAQRQKEKGNGYGYYILNSPEHHREYANTIMATGGSGKERNLIIQPMPAHTEKEEKLLKKKRGLNGKNVRIMTPSEWGRLQGFIGYGFVDSKTGKDTFSFPSNVPESQQYKQFGNSVSISVIETMADYIYEQLQNLNRNFEVILRNIDKKENGISRKSIIEGLNKKPGNASYILRKLGMEGKIKRDSESKKYHFVD